MLTYSVSVETRTGGVLCVGMCSGCFLCVQWDRMLNMIGGTLEKNGISNVFVKGNVHVRNKAITTFKV